MEAAGLELGGEPVSALLAAAHAAADAAAGPALGWFRRDGLGVEDKGGAAGFDPVTAADREVERAIRSALAVARPRDAVEGEEHAASAGEGPFSWMIDPIDGTRAFISGAPSWGVLIALRLRGRPVLGVIDQPFTGERFIGLNAPRAAGEWRRGTERRPLRARACAGLARATLFTTYPELGTAAERAAFDAVRGRVRLTRYGLDCYAYALLALGQIDLVIEAGLAPYDVQALIPVVEAAGGVITDWRGGGCAGGGRVVAAGDARTHAEALALLRAA